MEVNTINNRYQQPLSPTQVQQTLQSGVVLKGLSQLPPGAQPSHRFIVKTVHPTETRQSSISPINVRNSQGPQGPCMNCQHLQQQIQQLNRPCQNCSQLLEQIKYLTTQPVQSQNCKECAQLKEQISQKDWDLRELALRKEEELQTLQSQFQRIAFNSKPQNSEYESKMQNNQIEQLQQEATMANKQNEQLQDECTLLRNKLQGAQEQIRNYEQKIEDSKYSQYSNVDRYMIEIENLKDQLSTKVKELEVVSTKLFVVENTTRKDELLTQLQTQYEQLQTIYQLELAQNKQLMKKIETQSIDPVYKYRVEELEQDIRNKIKDHQSKIRLLTERYDSKIQNLQSENQIKLQQSKRDIDILKQQIQAHSSDIDISRNNNNKEINSLRRELDMKESYIHELLVSIDSWKEKYAMAQNKTEDYDNKISQLNKLIQNLQTQLSQVDVSQYQAEIDSWKANCYQLDQQSQSEIKLLQTEIQALKRALQQQNQKAEAYQSIQVQYASLKSAYTEQEFKLKQRTDEIIKLNKYFDIEVNKYKKFIEKQQIQIQIHQSEQLELVNLKQQINELQQQNLTLNSQLTFKIQEVKSSNKTVIDQYIYQLKEQDDQIHSLKLKVTTLENNQIDQSAILIKKDEEIRLWNNRYQSLEYRYTQLEQQLEDNQCDTLKAEIKRLQLQIVQLRSSVDQQSLEINDKVFIEKKFKEQELLLKDYKLSNTLKEVSEYTYEVPIQQDQVYKINNENNYQQDQKINRQFTFQDSVGLNLRNSTNNKYLNDCNYTTVIKDDAYTNNFVSQQHQIEYRDQLTKPTMNTSHLLGISDSLDVRKSKAQLDSRAQRWI